MLTGLPNYPRGKIYEGYGGLFRRERLDGVRVLRCWLYPHQSLGIAGRLANYFSFVLTSLVFGAVFLPRVDYLLTESPPLFLGITGYLLSRIKGARWIFNVSDLWPESAVRPGAARTGPGSLGGEVTRGVLLSERVARHGPEPGDPREHPEALPGRPTYHLSNGVDTEIFIPASVDGGAQELLSLVGAREPACVAVYAGLHGHAQGLDQILEAAARLRHRPNSYRYGR